MRALHVLLGGAVLVATLTARPPPAAAVCSVHGGQLSCYPTVCSVFSRYPCAPTVCSPFSRHPCTPQFPFSFGQGARFTIQSASYNPDEAVAPRGPLNTLLDVRDAIRGCWKWPPINDIHSRMDLTVLVSFKRGGELFGNRITYESRPVPQDDREVYHHALQEALRLCAPLPVSATLGGAIAGQPFWFYFHDTRQ